MNKDWQYYIPIISWVAVVTYWIRHQPKTFDDYDKQIEINIKVITGNVVVIGLSAIVLIALNILSL